MAPSSNYVSHQVILLTQESLFFISVPFKGTNGKGECSQGYLYKGVNNEVHMFN
jgi:hypothetical protein